MTENTGDHLHVARLSYPLQPLARNGLSGLAAIAGCVPYNAQIAVAENGEAIKHFESKLTGHYPSTAFVDPQYLAIFKYEWLAGNAGTALNAPYAVVLGEKRARQYFGSSSIDAMIGRQIVYDDSLTRQAVGWTHSWQHS